jgi:hypothetical protein
MHPAGFEPATCRLRAGGSAVELRVRRRVRPRDPEPPPPCRAPGRALCSSEQIQSFCPAAHWEGIEPSSAGFVDRCSVRLSYQCNRICDLRLPICDLQSIAISMRREGFEPPTSRLSGGCSASELTARVSLSLVMRQAGFEPATSVVWARRSGRVELRAQRDPSVPRRSRWALEAVNRLRPKIVSRLNGVKAFGREELPANKAGSYGRGRTPRIAAANPFGSRQALSS